MGELHEEEPLTSFEKELTRTNEWFVIFALRVRIYRAIQLPLLDGLELVIILMNINEIALLLDGDVVCVG